MRRDGVRSHRPSRQASSALSKNLYLTIPVPAIAEPLVHQQPVDWRSSKTSWKSSQAGRYRGKPRRS